MSPSVQNVVSAPRELSHPSKSSTQPLYRLSPIPGKGKGLLANQSISPGTCILSEPPLFTTANVNTSETPERALAAILKSLPKESQRAFLSLHNNNPGKEPLSNIVRSNAYPLGPAADVGGVFPQIARINHSCRSNAQQAWNERLGRETVYAVRPIAEGEEITVSYHVGGTSSARRGQLKQFFGFDCMCEICALPPAELAASDAKVLRAEQLDASIGDPKRVMLTPEKALGDCRALLRLYEDEGIRDMRLPRLWYDAFQIANMHGDEARARVFAQRSREARVLCEGEESEDARVMMGLSINPKGDESYGASKKWAQGVEKVPKDLDAPSFEKWLWRENK